MGKSAPFLPTVEKYTVEEVLLPKQPWELVRPKSSPKGVPYIIGVTSHEGKFYVYGKKHLYYIIYYFYNVTCTYVFCICAHVYCSVDGMVVLV